MSLTGMPSSLWPCFSACCYKQHFWKDNKLCCHCNPGWPTSSPVKSILTASKTFTRDFHPFPAPVILFIAAYMQLIGLPLCPECCSAGQQRLPLQARGRNAGQTLTPVQGGARWEVCKLILQTLTDCWVRLQTKQGKRGHGDPWRGAQSVCLTCRCPSITECTLFSHSF